MVSKTATRQCIRRALILISFLLFPITLNYFSPYLIIDGASQGIINGSFVLFGLLFLSSLVLGRGWCGWVCPAGGLSATMFAGWRPLRLSGVGSATASAGRPWHCG
jgi:polyferredoxin